jgi:hypothetical protein
MTIRGFVVDGDHRNNTCATFVAAASAIDLEVFPDHGSK